MPGIRKKVLSGFLVHSFSKYGFLFPDELIPGPYNVSFNNPQTSPIGITELSAQVKRKRMNRFERIIVLAGKSYVKIAEKIFEAVRLETPLHGCRGMGYMMKRLNELIEK